MKKLLLITFLFLITPDAKADMDYICEPIDNGGYKVMEYIAEHCERNNILSIRLIEKNQHLELIALWCRHDREINYGEWSGNTLRLVCVLYDNKPRTYTPVY